MPRLEFRLEWLEAERVKSPELAATWAYLSVRLQDAVLSRVLDHRARTVRDGVFVPLYPLAEWLAANWWALLYEFPTPEKQGDPDFVWRHSTACAREGYAYPPIEFVSSESRTHVRWERDELAWSKIEFIGPPGEDWLDKADFRESCEEFVDAVVRRLDGVGIEGTPLQVDWNAIRNADSEEAAFCRTAGGLGWDPYALDDGERELVLRIDRILSDDVLEQALPALDPANVDADLNAISSALEASRTSQLSLRHLRELRTSIVSNTSPTKSATPWQTGFALARQARRHLGLNGEPLPSFEALGEALSEDPHAIRSVTKPVDFGAAPLVDGVMSMSDSDAPGFAFQNRPEPSLRFHFCRALAETLLRPGQDALLTRAISDRQSLSRSFAAEFLAPSEALRELVTSTFVGDDDITRLASHFGVAPMVIQHQIENHHIAKAGRRRSQ
jgi:hypothetical protein